LPDYQNFWYDSGGARNKKTFAQFDAFIRNNQLFSDISQYFKIKRNIITSVPTTNPSIPALVNNNKRDSNSYFIFGDSMPGGIDIALNRFSNSEFIAKISNVGGQHSFKAVDGYLQKGVDVNLFLPRDIKTVYPTNPNGLWTGYDTDFDGGTVETYLTGLPWEASYIQVIWMGTNNPDNVWVGTPDYGQMHYRLIPDLQLAYDLSTQTTPKKGVIIMHGALASVNYAATKAAYEAKAIELGYEFIDPKSFFSDIYAALLNDDITHPIIAKALELDTAGNYIQYIGGKIYLYNETGAPRCNSAGQPLSQADAVVTTGQVQGYRTGWINIPENTPNTLVTINSVSYDVFNPCLVSGSVTGNPYTVDDPTTWPSSLHRDSVHPSAAALGFIAAQIMIFREQNNW